MASKTTNVIAGLQVDEEIVVSSEKPVCEPTDLLVSSGDGGTAPFRAGEAQSDFEREALREAQAINKLQQEKDRQEKDAARRNPVQAAVPKERGVFPTEKFSPDRVSGGDRTTAIGATLQKKRNVLPTEKYSPNRASGSGASGVAPASEAIVSPPCIEEEVHVESETNIFPVGSEEVSSGVLIEASLVPVASLRMVQDAAPAPIYMAEMSESNPESGLETIIAFLRTSRGFVLCLGLSLIIAGVAITSVLCSGGLCTSSPDTSSEAESTSSTPTPTVGTPSLIPTVTPSLIPTVAPTSEPLLDLLPNYTLLSLDDAFTAQSRAFEWLKHHPLRNDLPEWRLQELFAMATLFYSFGVTTYLNYSEPVCDWGEIPGCLPEGRVQSLTLGGDSSSSLMKLDGFMPPEIAMLSSLEAIQIAYTDAKITLANMIPTEMGLLTSLQNLNLVTCVQGTFPTEIGMLTRLTDLSLRGNSDFNGMLPTELGRLTALESIHLGDNQLTGIIPSESALLTRLEFLSFAHSQLTGIIPSELGSLTRLKELWLEGNQLSSTLPTELGLLTSLERFYAHINKINGTLPTNVGLMKNLRNLCLGWNSLTGTIPTEFGFLTSLHTMQLEHNPLSGSVPDEICALRIPTFNLHCPTNATCPEGCGCYCCGTDDCNTVIV